MLALPAGLVHLNIVSPYWTTSLQEYNLHSKKKADLNVFFANLNSQNKDHQHLLEYLQQNQPEYVLLVEVNSLWAKEIKTIKNLYPYSKAIIQEGNFGMAVLSKNPLKIKKVLVDKENMVPAMLLTSQSSKSQLNIVLLHAFPPIGSYGTISRDQYLKTISKEIFELKSPTLVCGDFNTTPWTPIFRKFLKGSNLKLNRHRRTPNTWPSFFFFPSIPIDHCLSKKLDIISYRRGPKIGSDHWPLLLKISEEVQEEITPEFVTKSENFHL